MTCAMEEASWGEALVTLLACWLTDGVWWKVTHGSVLITLASKVKTQLLLTVALGQPKRDTLDTIKNVLQTRYHK